MVRRSGCTWTEFLIVIGLIVLLLMFFNAVQKWQKWREANGMVPTIDALTKEVKVEKTTYKGYWVYLASISTAKRYGVTRKMLEVVLEKSIRAAASAQKDRIRPCQFRAPLLEGESLEGVCFVIEDKD